MQGQTPMSIQPPGLAAMIILMCMTVLVCMTAPASLAQNAPASRYTSVTLASPECRPSTGPAEGFSCTGLAGWTINLGFPALGLTLNFSHEKSGRTQAAPADGRQVPTDDLAGKTTRVEWRGTTAGGSFEPYAAIIRVLVLDDAQRQEKVEKGSPLASAQPAQILIVTRLGKEGACVVAYVDAKANPAPNELARAAADTLGQKTKCPVAQIEIRGRETPGLTGYLR